MTPKATAVHHSAPSFAPSSPPAVEARGTGRGGLSRRTVLQGAAAAMVLTAGNLGPVRAAPARRTDHVDVAIVGSGIAGLTAARILTRAGRSVVVLEARDRIGGRMVRQQVAPDVWVDLGGQWVGPTQERIIALADELGVKRFPWFHDGETRFVYRDIDARFDGDFPPFSGDPPPVPEDELEDAKRAWDSIEALAATVPLEAPWKAPDAERLDQETLGAWVDRTTHTDFARFCVTNMARIGGSGAFEPDQVSTLHMAFTQATGPQSEDPEAELFYGAAGQIPQLLVREIGEDNVKLSSPVWAIEQDDAGVIVRTPDDEYRARYVIVAIPPTLTGGIIYDPPLPRQRIQLVQRMPMGSLIREYAIYPTAFWREDGLNGVAITDLPTTPFTADSSPPGGEPGIMTTYIAGNPADALERRSAEERREAVLADLVKCFGPQAANPTEFIEMNWPAETWTRGAFTAYLPPGAWTAYGEALRAPVGRIHWAGAETASRWNGYFDGGVRSAEDAAAAILARL